MTIITRWPELYQLAYISSAKFVQPIFGSLTNKVYIYDQGNQSELWLVTTIPLS